MWFWGWCLKNSRAEDTALLLLGFLTRDAWNRHQPHVVKYWSRSSKKTKNIEVSHKALFYTDLNLALDHVWELVALNGIPQASPLSRKNAMTVGIIKSLIHSESYIKSEKLLSKPKQCFWTPRAKRHWQPFSIQKCPAWRKCAVLTEKHFISSTCDINLHDNPLTVHLLLFKSHYMEL